MRIGPASVAGVLLVLLAGCAGPRGLNVSERAAVDRLAVAGSCKGTAFVFFQPDASPSADEAALAGGEVLGELDGVLTVEVLDQEATFAEFVELFADTPQLVDNVSPEILSPSARARYFDPAVVAEVESFHATDRSVRQVMDAPVGQKSTPGEVDAPPQDGCT